MRRRPYRRPYRRLYRRQLTLGLREEREHDDVTGGDPRLVRRTALAHLREDPRYYTKLARCFRKNPLRVTEEYLGGHHGQKDLVLRATDDSGRTVAALEFSVFRGRVHVNHIRSSTPGAGFRLANALVEAYGLNKIAPGMTTPDGTRLLAAVRKRWQPQVEAARLWRRHARATSRNPARSERQRGRVRRRNMPWSRHDDRSAAGYALLRGPGMPYEVREMTPKAYLRLVDKHFGPGSGIFSWNRLKAIQRGWKRGVFFHPAQVIPSEKYVAPVPGRPGERYRVASHEGRHRAYAALLRGDAKIPVLVWPKEAKSRRR